MTGQMPWLRVLSTGDGRWWSLCYAGNHNEVCRTVGHSEHLRDTECGLVWFENTVNVLKALRYQMEAVK